MKIRLNMMSPREPRQSWEYPFIVVQRTEHSQAHAQLEYFDEDAGVWLPITVVFQGR